MLQLVNVGQKALVDYATIVSRGLMDEIRRLAEPLAGKRVAHLSATAFGGGVAEINYALVPLMKDAGLDVEWRVIAGGDEFFAVTKAIHNALQGSSEGLSKTQEEIFRCHIDLSAPNPSVLEFLIPWLSRYDATIFHMPEYAPAVDGLPPGYIWPPAIDPL